MILLAAALTFILGTAIGSFLSVVIHRLHSGKKGIVASRSVCPHCNNKLKARHLVPIFSWLFLRGKCGFCGKKISAHYVMLELITGLAFLTVFVFFNFLEPVISTVDTTVISYTINWEIFEKFIFYIVEFSFLIGIFFYDMMYQEIPDTLSLPAIVIGIAGGLLMGSPAWLSMLIGAAALFLFFLAQLLVSKGAWVGGGDLRMGVLLGVLLGWDKGLAALIIAYLIGAIVSIILIATKKAGRKTAIAFGPFMIIGLIMMIFYGETIINYYLTTFTAY